MSDLKLPELNKIKHWKGTVEGYRTADVDAFKEAALRESAADKQRIAELEAEAGKAKRAREHTWKWYASHYGKLEDWARKRLPEPWCNEFFSCIANGTWGHDDVGKRYTCKAGFDVVPSGYIHMDDAKGQLICDQTKRAEDAESRAERAESELATRLKMFVWDGRGKYKVTVCASSIAEARALALEEISLKGDLLNMREHVEHEQPLIYHRPNAEIALTENGETEELNICLEAETKRRQAAEAEIAKRRTP